MKQLFLAIMVVVALCNIAVAQVNKGPIVLNWSTVRLDSLEHDTTAWQDGRSFNMSYLSTYATRDTLAGLPQLTYQITYQYLYNHVDTGRKLDTVTVVDTLNLAADSLETTYIYTIIPGSWRWRIITFSSSAKTNCRKQTYNWR